MKKVVKCVKRPSVNWYEKLCSLEDLELSKEFWLFKSLHKNMSDNRCAYNVLKKHYSTTALNNVRWLGAEL